MGSIIKEILKDIPQGKISDAVFEGANIVLYTKNKKFLQESPKLIKGIVDRIKKRIELRADPSILPEEDDIRKKLPGMMPEEAGVDNLIFDIQRSIVIVEAEKPGMAIGKQGENLQRIKDELLWTVQVRRAPVIRSKVMENIRSVLYQNNDYRRKFLNKVGERVYNGWVSTRRDEWVRITFLGAGRQVGRSAILLQTPESRILLDCGVDISKTGDDMYPHLEAPEFDISKIDAVIITHGHIDHCGLLPYLFKFGYNGPVYSTAPTRDIMVLQQLDMVKIQKMEGQKELYSTDDVTQVVKNTITLNFEEVTDITPDVRLTLYDSGHILGSAMAHLHIGNGLHNMLYTADIKFARTHLLNPAATSFPRLETLIVEATYGGKDNVGATAKQADDLMSDLVKRTVERKGKVLMPVLGSGRAQEVLVFIQKLISEGRIPEVPIYIDGMVWDITAIHTAYPEFLNKYVRQMIFSKEGNPFLRSNVKRVGSHQERMKVIEEEGSCIILATSGMLVGGPSVEYLKRISRDKRHSLIFSSYLGPGTLAKRIFSGEREIWLKNTGNESDLLVVNMEISKVNVSSHADRRELMNFIGKCHPKPRKVIVNHGEVSKVLDLASSIHRQYRVETLAPRNLDAMRLR